MNEAVKGSGAKARADAGEQLAGLTDLIDPRDPRPLIEWRAGKSDRATDLAEAVLMGSGEPIFQRADMIVRVIERPGISARNFRRQDGVIGLIQVDRAYLIDALTRLAKWARWDARSGALRAINCPDRVATSYLSRIGCWKLPRLWAAVNAPTMRPDGTILQKPGYDAETAILFDPGALHYPEIPETPTRAQAEAALEDLVEAIGSFPFVENVDRSVALATVISALVRRSLPGAPITGITSPVMGSGKTLLADIFSILATGVSAAAMVHPADEEEASKLLLSVLSEGEAIVLIDNVERPLEGAWLCAALTSESYTARLLGRNATIKVPTSCSWIATGNSLVLSGDLRTRALLCRLDPRCEHPEERQFEGDLREQILERRASLVSAGLTLARAFVVSGKRAADVVRPWGRFEAWSERVRAPLVWLGQPDPCASRFQLEQEDPERARLAAMLTTFRQVFGDHAATGRELIDSAVRNDNVRETVEAVARDRSGQLDALRLGRWLQKVAGRIVGGFEFRRDGIRQGAVLWRVVGALADQKGPRS